MNVGAPHERRTVSMICGNDRRTHRVDDDALSLGVADHSGRFLAVCGHSVQATSLLLTPGTSCELCLTVLSIGELEARQSLTETIRIDGPAVGRYRPPGGGGNRVRLRTIPPSPQPSGRALTGLPASRPR
jgi:hypothetical protein